MTNTGRAGSQESDLLSEQSRTPSAITTAMDHLLSQEFFEGMQKFYKLTCLERVAEDPQTDAIMLSLLGRSCEPDIRMAVAENSNTPRTTLLALAYDECTDVRFRLAESYSAPRDILLILSNDENPYVSFRAKTTLELSLT